MEFEKPLLRDTFSRRKVDHSSHTQSCARKASSPKPVSNSQETDDMSRGMDSFRILEMGVPKSDDSASKKISWLRSQIIGGNAEFESPFGKRRLTYADHTASGRSLHYIENYITNNVLPFYGMSLYIFCVFS